MSANAAIHIGGYDIKMRGRVRAQVVDSRTRKVKQDCGWQPNLILNGGFEGIQNYSTAQQTVYAVCGTGTTPTQDDSGTTTAAQSGTTVTLSGGSFVFSSGNAGDTIKWDTGQEARIVSYTNTTTVTVHSSATVSAGEFTLYRTSQSILASEISPTIRTNTYLTGTGNTETTYDAANGIQKNRRTYDFAAETGSVTYTEVGFSRLGTLNAALFSRVLLASSLSLVAGDQLRLIYEVEYTLTPYAPRAISTTITGWGTLDGDEMCEHFGLHYISSTGSTSGTVYHKIEPVASAYIFISDSTTALSTSPQTGTTPLTNRAGTTRFYKAATNAFSGAGTLQMQVVKSGTFTTTEGNMTGIRSLALIHYSSSTYYINHAVLLDVAQTKANTSSLTLNWTITWSRTLS